MISTPLDQDSIYPLPFPGQLGRGLRIAVIDSGVNPRHPHMQRLDGGVSIDAEGKVTQGEYLDTLGHGTAVMAAIQEKAPEAMYFAVKIFDTALRAKTSALLQGIRWSIDNSMDLVNLSLGTRKMLRKDHFQTLVNLAAMKGITMIAAHDADGQPCLPGCLEGVLGVTLDWDCPRNRYRVANDLFQASGYPRPIPGYPMERNLHGISFAVANMTGLAARAAESLAERNPSTIRQALLDNPTL